MKLTEKQKIEIYQKRKQGTPIPCLSLEYGINKSGIKYLVRLIDAHGLDIVKHACVIVIDCKWLNYWSFSIC